MTNDQIAQHCVPRDTDQASRENILNYVMDALTVKEREGVRVINPMTCRKAEAAIDELTGDIIDGLIGSNRRERMIQDLMDGYLELKRSPCANVQDQRRMGADHK